MHLASLSVEFLANRHSRLVDLECWTKGQEGEFPGTLISCAQNKGEWRGIPLNRTAASWARTADQAGAST